MKFTFGPEAHPLSGYTIKRAIDRGAFGEVYYALSDSGKEVALKLLRDNQHIELRGVSQCLNLKHPNLVTLFDVRTDADGDSWVIMEYIAGESLEQHLAANPKGISPEETLQWLAGVADGVGHLHDKGIVHRDLKPANVFRDQGIVKVGDVGLSKFMTPSRRSAQTESVGTVYYMAPEVARGKYGRELDVYSLGVIVYEMLTGFVPFNGESTGEILMKHLTARPDLSVIAEPFRPVLERALEKDPQRRTPTVRKLAEEFRVAFAQWQPGQRPLYVKPVPGVDEVQQAAWRDVRPRVREIPAARGNDNSGWSYRPHAERLEQKVSGNSRKPGSRLWLWLAIPAGVFLLLRGDTSPLLFFSPFQMVKVSPLTWFFILMVGGLAYGTYCAVSAIVTSLLAPSSSPVRTGLGGNLPAQTPLEHYAAPAPISTSQASSSRPARSWEWLGPEIVRTIPFSVRWQDICTSMAWATFWTIVCTAATVLGVDYLFTYTHKAPLVHDAGQLSVFGFTALTGAWILILATKLMEGSRLRQQERRLVLAFCGAAVGGVAWWLGQFQQTAIVGPRRFPGLFQRVGDWPLLKENGTPSLVGLMVFFAILFAIRNWWNQTDSFRGKAFRWGSILFTGLVAWAIPAAFAFPQTWAACWGLTLSAVVQLSSGWIPANQRAAIVNASQSQLPPTR